MVLCFQVNKDFLEIADLVDYDFENLGQILNLFVRIVNLWVLKGSKVRFYFPAFGFILDLGIRIFLHLGNNIFLGEFGFIF